MDANQSSILLQFIPLLFLSTGIGIQSLLLAREKGRNVVLWAILGFIPVINFFCIWYFVGAANLKHEEKLNEILKHIQRAN